MKVISLFIILVLFGLDQLSKNFAQKEFLEPLLIIDPWFRFRFVENTGVAFSMPVPSVFVIMLTVVVLGYLLYVLFRKTLKRYELVALVLIFAGALGNLIDRIRFGAVTDFISVGSFPVFNLADTWISIGVAIYLIGEILLKEKEEERREKK